MTRSASDIQADIDAINAAIGTGALKVRFADGRETTYRSQAELERAIAWLRGELGSMGGTPPVRTTYAAHSRD